MTDTPVQRYGSLMAARCLLDAGDAKAPLQDPVRGPFLPLACRPQLTMAALAIMSCLDRDELTP